MHNLDNSKSTTSITITYNLEKKIKVTLLQAKIYIYYNVPLNINRLVINAIVVKLFFNSKIQILVILSLLRGSWVNEMVGLTLIWGNKYEFGGTYRNLEESICISSLYKGAKREVGSSSSGNLEINALFPVYPVI